MDSTDLNEKSLWRYLQMSPDHTRIYNQDKSVYIEKFSTPSHPIVVEVWGNDEDEDYDVSIKESNDLSQVVHEFRRLGGSLADIKQAIEQD